MSSAVNALIPQLANYNPAGFALRNQELAGQVGLNAAQQQQVQANTGLRQQATQKAALENQLMQQQLRDSQILRSAYAQHADDDWSDPQTEASFENTLVKNAISYPGLSGYRNENLKWRQGLQTLQKEGLANEEQLNQRTTDILQGYKDIPDAQKPQMWTQVTAPALNGLHRGQFDPTNPLVGTALDGVIGIVAHHKALMDEAKTAQETEASKATQAETEAKTQQTQLATQLERAQLAHYQTLTQTPQALESYVEQSIPAAKYPELHQAAVNEARQQPDLKGINAVVEKYSQDAREQERTLSVELDPRVAALRQKQEQDRANYQNALTQGDTATAKYFESATDVHQTLAAARSIEHIIDLARGNPIAGNQLELIVPEFTAAMQGIKPRGMQLNEKGFSSTWDRIYNEVKSAKPGESSLGASTLNQIMPYVRTIANGAVQNHNATRATINQVYHKNFPEEPTPYQNTANAPSAGGLVRYSTNGRTYNIPANLEAQFLRDHPGAQKQ